MQALGYSEPQIKMWLSRGAFSNPVKPRLLMEAMKRKIALAPELIGLEEKATPEPAQVESAA